ncbi:Uma2 family endonuclease [Microcoleus sp. FACHB-68]|uniref:Uma2 family endonuclease n=1 Tax=Microcoleus sp. FACHB-68 TaxID=2692826 RepID=UPI00321FF44C
MNMQTVPATPPSQQQVPVNSRFILSRISWETFKALLADAGDDRAWRIAYDAGVLEFRMPLQEHEQPKILIAYFVTAIADELEIETMELGALLLVREDLRRAVEPDTCFYIQNESVVRGKSIELPNDPPPDLVIESDYTSSSLNKFTIYASLGVPELWRYRNQILEIYQLAGDRYELCEKSLAFPFLPASEIPGFIEQSKTAGQRATVRAFRSRIREILHDSE